MQLNTFDFGITSGSSQQEIDYLLDYITSLK
jgi:hypothetical protein